MPDIFDRQLMARRQSDEDMFSDAFASISEVISGGGPASPPYILLVGG